MLLNKNGGKNNSNLNLNELNMDYSAHNFDGSVNLDENNKDVNNFFTVVRSQIDNENNAPIDTDNIDHNFDFEINMNDFRDENLWNIPSKSEILSVFRFDVSGKDSNDEQS